MQQKINNDTSFTKVQPHLPEAEQAVVGAIISQESVLHEVISFLHPEMFYDFRYRAIYEAILSLNSKRKPIELISVTQEVAALGKAEEVTPYFVTQTMGASLTSVYAVEHALMVKQKYLQRKAIELSHHLREQAYDEMEDIGDVLFRTGEQIEALQESLIGRNEIKSFQQVAEEALKDLQRKMDLYRSGKQTGINTGLDNLNRITAGWQKSELVVLAARPSMGKTALSLHFAKAAAKQGIPVAFFSLEMSGISLYNRVMLSESEIDPDKLKSGDIGPVELEQIEKAAMALYKLPIYVDDNASVSLSYIRSRCRLLKKQDKCGMVIIDYLQLASESGQNNRSREQEITKMSREAKIIAKELDVPVLLLSQLNRDVEKRLDKKPILSDLRESGSIEQDADMVIFIHRPEYYRILPTDPDGNPIINYGELLIQKNRNGPTGVVKFNYNDTLTRIFDHQTQ